MSAGTVAATGLRRRRLDRARDDAGVTLVEMLTAMGIFTVVIAVFLAGLVTMTRSTARSQDVIDAGDAVRKAFQTMDKQIRYASSINFPGRGASGAVYVEFVRTAPTAGAPAVCTQWRYDPATRVLQVRTWEDIPTATVSGWSTIATDVRNDLAGASPNLPFVLTPAGGGTVRQQLAVSIDVGDGPGGTGAERGAATATVFVARNSSTTSPSNADGNTDGRSDTPVCTTYGERS